MKTLSLLVPLFLLVAPVAEGRTVLKRPEMTYMPAGEVPSLIHANFCNTPDVGEGKDLYCMVRLRAWIPGGDSEVSTRYETLAPGECVDLEVQTDAMFIDESSMAACHFIEE